MQLANPAFPALTGYDSARACQSPDLTDRSIIAVGNDRPARPTMLGLACKIEWYSCRPEEDTGYCQPVKELSDALTEQKDESTYK